MRISAIALMAALAGAMPATAQTPATFTLHKPLRDMTDSRFVQGTGDKITVLDEDSVANALTKFDVVVYGEIHSHPGVHVAEMRLLSALYERNLKMIVSFEQFETDTQGVVDDYLAGKIGENALTTNGRAWPQYVTAYRPMMEFARVHSLPVVAAEAPTWAVACIGQNGPAILDQFAPEDRALVAKDLAVPKDGPYRDKYMEFALGGAHGGGDPAKAERSFAAQMARDSTMAERIVAALDAHPGSQVIHYTGYFHAEGWLGTAGRIQAMRPDLKVAVVLPVEVPDPALPSADFAKVSQGTVLQLVWPSPPSFVDGEDTSAAMASMMSKKTPCKYGQ